MKQELLLFKTQNGEEIIGRVAGVDEEANETIFEKLRVLGIQKNPNSGRQQEVVVFYPWMMGNPDGATGISNDYIIARALEIPAEFEKAYIRTTTAIDLSASK